MSNFDVELGSNIFKPTFCSQLNFRGLKTPQTAKKITTN